MVSVITAWGVQWTGLPHSPKTDSDCLIKDNRGIKERGVAVGGCRSSVAECWRLKPEALSSIPGGATFLSFPLLFQRSTDSNGPDYLWLDDHYRSLDCGGVPSIGLSTLWLRSPSTIPHSNHPLHFSTLRTCVHISMLTIWKSKYH